MSNTLQTAGQAMESLAGARDLIAAQQVEIEQLRSLVDALKLQAKCYSHEARGANATIAEIYQLCTGATGEPGNWNGADPVRAVLERKNALLKSILHQHRFDVSDEVLAAITKELKA